MNIAVSGSLSSPGHDQGAPLQTFVRSLTIPSGLPWDQTRAAELEARMSAPASLDALQYRLVRIEPWSLGRPGRFAVVYLRTGQGLDTHTAEVVVDGRAIKVSFQSVAARRQETVKSLQTLAIVTLPLVLLAVAIVLSITIASAREEKIELLEAKAARATLLQTRLARLRSDGQLLRAAGADGHRLSDAVADLDWLAQSRSPQAHIQAVHWENGLMTVEVRGDAAPVRSAEREVRRAERPLAPWTYLWGIGRPVLAPR